MHITIPMSEQSVNSYSNNYSRERNDDRLKKEIWTFKTTENTFTYIITPTAYKQNQSIPNSFKGRR